MNTQECRKIAILADAHGLLEPTQAVLEDIYKRGITEIYSLGDNVGEGPNPGEVLDLLESYGVTSIAGNSEDYVTLGLAPFLPYFTDLKAYSCLWTYSQLNDHQKSLIYSFPHSLELNMGGKNIGLCHFANDVRFDYTDNSTSAYQRKLALGEKGYEQFLYTNSECQRQRMYSMLASYGKNNPEMKGYISAMEEPLFRGQMVEKFDAIIGGHVHWKIYESSPKTDFYSIRAVGMAYDKDPVDSASYVILTEKENGYDFEEVLVPFDREKMVNSILNSNCPGTRLYDFVRLTRHK